MPSTTLLDTLRSKADGERLVRNLEERVKVTAERKLRRIGSLFSEYTDHGIEHSESVIGILD